MVEAARVGFVAGEDSEGEATAVAWREVDSVAEE